LLGKIGLFDEETGVAILLNLVNKKHARSAYNDDHEQNNRQPHI